MEEAALLANITYAFCNLKYNSISLTTHSPPDATSIGNEIAVIEVNVEATVQNEAVRDAAGPDHQGIEAHVANTRSTPTPPAVTTLHVNAKIDIVTGATREAGIATVDMNAERDGTMRGPIDENVEIYLKSVEEEGEVEEVSVVIDGIAVMVDAAIEAIAMHLRNSVVHGMTRSAVLALRRRRKSLHQTSLK